MPLGSVFIKGDLCQTDRCVILVILFDPHNMVILASFYKN